MKVPRSIGRFSLNIFGDLWGGKNLSLCWYECRMGIPAYMHVEIRVIVMGSDSTLLVMIGNLLEEL